MSSSLASFCPTFNLSNADLELWVVPMGKADGRRDVPITEGLLGLRPIHTVSILLPTFLHVALVYEFYAYDHHIARDQFSFDL